MRKKWIGILVLVLAVVVIAVIAYHANRTKSGEHQVAYYAQRVGLPTNLTKISDETTQREGNVLYYENCEAGYDESGAIEYLRVDSPELAVLGDAVRVGDSLQTFQEFYQTKESSASVFHGEYSPENAEGVLISCESKDGVITSIEVRKLLLK